MSDLSIARDFSRFPAGRYLTDGKNSGERFRAMLVAKLKAGSVCVDLDGTMGYGSSFLEEAFGGLVRSGFAIKQLKERLSFSSSDESLVTEIWSYIEDAQS
jgi:hypothetical protein